MNPTNLQALLATPAALPPDLVRAIAHHARSTGNTPLTWALLERPELTATDLIGMLDLALDHRATSIGDAPPLAPIAHAITRRTLTIDDVRTLARMPLPDVAMTILANGLTNEHINALLTDDSHPGDVVLLAARTITDHGIDAVRWLIAHLEHDPDTYREPTALATAVAAATRRSPHQLINAAMTITDPQMLRRLLYLDPWATDPTFQRHAHTHLTGVDGCELGARYASTRMATTIPNPSGLTDAVNALPADLDWDVFTTLLTQQDPHDPLATHITAIIAAMSGPPPTATAAHT